MSKREALIKSLEHWRENEKRVNSIGLHEAFEATKNSACAFTHTYVKRVFGIAIDNKSCALCSEFREVCTKCPLCAKGFNPLTDTCGCCKEWFDVYLAFGQCMWTRSEVKFTKLMNEAVKPSLSAMVRRIEQSLEKMEEKNEVV